MAFDVEKTLEHGIERIVYRPKAPRFKTPIVMQHGMWHGAWCWHLWAELLAEWGWECHTHSLPGHGESPVQRPIRWCTLGYYLKFLRAEIERMPQTPVLMGHSMGGALTQWYLRYVGDLPAAVLVAPWTSHDMVAQVLQALSYDFVGSLLSTLTVSTAPMVRNPQRAGYMFLSQQAVISPEELHRHLGPESIWVLLQYNILQWSPRQDVQTPMLWLGGAADTIIPEYKSRRSAQFYGAQYHAIAGAGHNIMMESDYRDTAQMVHNWLVERGIA